MLERFLISHLTFRPRKLSITYLAFSSKKKILRKILHFCNYYYLDMYTSFSERSTATIFSRSFLKSFHSPPPIPSPLNDHGFLVQNQSLFDIGGRSSGFSPFNFVQDQIRHSWFDLGTTASQLSGRNPHAGHLVSPKS